MGSNINTKRITAIILMLLTPIFLLFWIDTFRIYEYAGLFSVASLGCTFLFVGLLLGLVTGKIR